jgi:hypothetical protein
LSAALTVEDKSVECLELLPIQGHVAPPFSIENSDRHVAERLNGPFTVAPAAIGA